MTERQPVRIVVLDDLRRSRPTIALRLLLAIPHLLWAELWRVAAVAILLVSWPATLIGGRSPRRLHDFLAGYVRYATRVYAYLFIVANPFPAFFTGRSTGVYPIDLEVDLPQP